MKKMGGCPHCGDKRFSQVRYADSFNRKFKIDTPENIRAAWNAIQLQRQTKQYSEAELRKLEEKIINAWVEHIGLEPPAKKW